MDISAKLKTSINKVVVMDKYATPRWKSIDELIKPIWFVPGRVEKKLDNLEVTADGYEPEVGMVCVDRNTNLMAIFTELGWVQLKSNLEDWFDTKEKNTDPLHHIREQVNNFCLA